MVHSTKVLGQWAGLGSLYCLPSRLSSKLSILPPIRYLGNGNQQVPWADGGWCLREEAIVVWGEKGESLSVVTSADWLFWLHFYQGSRVGYSLYFGYLCSSFPNTPRYLEKFDHLMAVTRQFFAVSRNQWWTTTKLWPAIPVNDFSLLHQVSDIEKQSGFVTFWFQQLQAEAALRKSKQNSAVP